MREVLTDAFRYWEIRRIVYNAVLAAIVVFYFVLGLPKSTERLTFDLLQGLFILAVLANIAFCAAYIADVAAHFSGFRDVWIRFRIGLLLIGILFAGIITRVFAMGFFNNAT